MGLKDRVTSIVSTEGEQVTFTYYCRECETEFERAEQSTSRVSCPTCKEEENISKF